MMKRKKILITIMSIIIIIATVIPMYALDNNRFDLTTIPDDIGNVINDYTNITQNKIIKLYLVINISGNSITTGRRLNCSYSYYNNGGTSLDKTVEYIILNYDSFYRKIFNMASNSTYYSFLFIPNFYLTNDASTTLYIPIYMRNINNISFELLNNENIQMSYTLHYSTDDESTIASEAFQLGYNNGYTNGYDDGFVEGQGIEQYTNLVGYVEQLIGQFTGSDAAQYITPIAIVLVVLFVYFLFIRFLLSLVKAKGIIKTCDIIMIVACIIMLVVMYAPMLDLTIKTEQINSSEETTETVQVRNSNIYVETTETGDIYYGPVGTAIVTKRETIEDIYKISEDIETEAIAYENN